MTPEAAVKAAIKRALATLGADVWALWPVSNGMGAPALDCHGCYKGLSFSIEAKAPGKVPTPRQDQTIERIAAAGGVVLVISSKEGAQEIPRVLEEHHAKGRHRHQGC